MRLAKGPQIVLLWKYETPVTLVPPQALSVGG